MSTRNNPAALLLVAALALAGCASSFNANLARGYQGTTTARDTAALLLDHQVIDADEAQQVQDQADNARAGLDIAGELRATDPERADDKLTATLRAVRALRAYLDKYLTLEEGRDAETE